VVYASVYCTNKVLLKLKVVNFDLNVNQNDVLQLLSDATTPFTEAFHTKRMHVGNEACSFVILDPCFVHQVVQITSG